VTPGLPFREDGLAIGHDLEHPTGPLDEVNGDIGELLLELGRQPGGPGLVVSDDAVSDRDLHGILGGGVRQEAES
jgi:hypothetical protein